MVVNKIPQRVLFVCLGNIVRSPLAEGLFKHYCAQAGLSDVFIADSAGTSGWHVGEQPDRRMLRVASEHGIHYTHRSRQIQTQDLDQFDLLVAMDRDNYEDIQAMTANDAQRQKIHLMREWDNQSKKNLNVPDPYYGGRGGFEEVFLLVDRSVRRLIEYLNDANS